MFQKVCCPVCNLEVVYVNINKHLDTECSAEISPDDVKIIDEFNPSLDDQDECKDRPGKKRKLENKTKNNKRPRKDTEEFRDLMILYILF